VKILTLKDKYRYFETDLEYIYQDSGITEETDVNISVKNSQGDTLYSETKIMPKTGYIGGKIRINRDNFIVGSYILVVDTELKEFVVDYRAVLIEKGLSELLTGFEHIDVYDEIGVQVPINMCNFTFKNWVPDTTKLRVLKNGEDLEVYKDIYIDFDNGRLHLKNNSILDTDDINVTYQFSIFGEDTYASFLDLALDELNSSAPATAYDFESAPRVFDPAMVMRAYSKCLGRLLLDLSFWNNTLIFPEPTALKSTIQAMYQAALTEFQELKKSAKGLRMVRPRGISSQKIGMPVMLDGVNYKNWTIASIAQISGVR